MKQTKFKPGDKVRFSLTEDDLRGFYEFANCKRQEYVIGHWRNKTVFTVKDTLFYPTDDFERISFKNDDSNHGGYGQYESVDLFELVKDEK